MESFHNAQLGRYELSTLDAARARPADGDGPIVDMREEYAADGPDVILSRAAVRRDGDAARAARAVDRAAEPARIRDRRVLPPVRRHARLPELQRVADRAQGAARRARCHYCNYSMRAAEVVPAIAPAPYLEQIGFGTERVEAEFRDAVPAARVAASIATRFGGSGAIAALLAQFARRRDRRARRHADDRERARLSARDAGRRHFGGRGTRASPTSAPRERTFQLLTQVAGRAGRGEIRGEAIVQTLYPNHYSIRPRLPAGLRRVLPARRSTFRRGDALSAGRRADQRHRQGAHATEAMDDAGELVNALRVRRRAVPGARSSAGAAQPAEGRIPRAVLHQRQRIGRRCGRRCRRSCRPGRRSAAGRSSMWIRCPCL